MENLLSLLRKEAGRVVSGALLSRALGVSRTAVWKRVNRLREMGYEIASSPSSGYRFISAPDLLLPEEIRYGLKAGTFTGKIHYLERTESTQTIARDMARQGASEGTLIVADAQSRGKGRLGRSWVSPPKCNLYFSMILKPDVPPAWIPQITLVSAASLCESLIKETGLPVRIRWPNDLWIGEKKAGGILTEMSADMDQVNYVVLGAGINVNMTRDDIPADLQETATSLFLEAGRTFSRVALFRRFLQGLERDYAVFCKHGFIPFRERWTALSMTIGRQVRVGMPQREIQGLALEIGEQGRLRIRREDGTIEEVVSGDVTVMEKGR
ncbi:MAG: biotin--[acetyl-CoA-carboxylase] ligase [Nitrospirae bacterium CG08_land_8_20_14_0_20_52_24]|nr:MAG: biotin--[acetyl-CoA-carboxylase] ligase [Nitrospirae bacterium CG2_30_53_67]PIS37035.1 MAG: biotin--[acetyl-CoA-carboxylase] ligase [Nitrospirae bacterium CG08_land_8_20_14_0_20_52_24]PIX86302.1 MAG: biotin--[acetyl-CoA-carboxylase] ligase [Nitrospirae bacterium CG_4_10_14_3_um_filter_53_41]